MPVVQCGPNINCIGVDSPVANLSAELPDVPKCFRYAFTAQSEYVCEFDLSLCEAFSGVGSDVGLLCSPPPQIIDYQNPPPVLVYSSSAQRCTVDCGGFSETYEVVAGTFVGLSQALADAAAHSFACELATILCTGPLPAIYTNSEQSCTVNCPNGTTFTYTTPAGFFSALSQSDANIQAFIFACELAALLCSGLPPVNTVTSAGSGPSTTPNTALYGNFAQSCSAACPDGSTFTYVVPGGNYFRESRLAANSVAFSAACRFANAFKVCLSDLERAICADIYYGEFLDATGLTAPITFAVVAGALPSGVTLGSDGFLQGIPTIAGDYTFSIRATGADGNYAQRTYTQTVGDITPDVLADGSIGTAYAQALTANGFSNPTFAIVEGALPDGLTIGPSTGVISGTPTTGGDYDFTVQVSDGSLTCDKVMLITISGAVPAVWYTCESVEPIIDAVAGNNMVRDAGSGTAPVATTGGKVALGVYSETTGDQCVFKTGQVAALAPTGDDMHFFGWVQLAPPVLQKDQLYQQFDYVTAGGQALAFRFVGDGSYLVYDNTNIIFSGAVGTIPAGVWTFWHLKVDGATGNFEFSLNNAASASLPTDFSPVADVTGDFEVLFLYNQAEGSVNTKMDEVAIFIGAMTQGDVDAIYNSGNGKTYP